MDSSTAAGGLAHALEHQGANASATGEAGNFSAAVQALTSAFGDATRRQIYLFLSERDGATAGEVARHFELHPNVARHHLDKLAAGGYLEVSLDHPPSGAGRPSKRYRRLDPAPVPSLLHQDELVVALLVKALELLPDDVAAAMAEEVGETYGRNLAAHMAPGCTARSTRSAVLAIADALTAHGFAARAEHREEKTAIYRDHCPFGNVAVKYPVLCAVDRGMVQGLFSGLCGDKVPVELSTSRALGDDSCVTVAG